MQTRGYLYLTSSLFFVGIHYNRLKKAYYEYRYVVIDE